MQLLPETNIGKKDIDVSGLYINNSNFRHSNPVDMALKDDPHGDFPQCFCTIGKNEPYVPACLSLGSLNMQMIDEGCGRSGMCFPFIETTHQDAQVAVKKLFTLHPLMTIEAMVKRFEGNFPGRSADPCQKQWVLFVKTNHRDKNGDSNDTYTLINNDMPFLSIPEYLLSNCCLAICNNIHARFHDRLGTMLPDIAGYSYLVKSASLTAMSQVQFYKDELAEAERIRLFEVHHFEYAGRDKIRADELYASNIATRKLQVARYEAEALKHQNTHKKLALAEI